MRYCLLVLILFHTWTAKGQSSCSDAIVATLGENNLSATDAEYYWYSFTMPSDGEIEITSSGTELVYIYSNSCHNPQYIGRYYENAKITSLLKGEEVLIRWDTKDGSGFTWNLLVGASEAGVDCRSGAEAVEGTNTVPPTDQEEYWYHFTMPGDGKLTLTNSDSKYAYVYSNTCAERKYPNTSYKGEENDLSYTTINDLHGGEEVYIKWLSVDSNGFDWNLSVAAFEDGDRCDRAVTAKEGVNTIPAGRSQGLYWYRFTMPRGGKLKLEASRLAQVYLYDTCTRYSRSAEYSIKTPNIDKGEEVLFAWEQTYSDFDNLTWNLSVISSEEDGDDCDVAASAVEGSNTLPSTEADSYWYRFIMPIGGKLEINTSAEEYVHVYGACGRSYGDSGYQNVTVSDLDAGKELFIKWQTLEGGNFNWQLTIEPFEQGEHPSSATNAIEGNNITPTTSKRYYWYKYTMPTDGKLEVSTAARREMSFYRNGYDGESYLGRFYKQGSIPSLNAGDEVLIRWYLYSGNVGNFNWDLSVKPMATGEDCSVAAVAREGVNTVPPTLTGRHWYSFVMPEDGKLEITSTSRERVAIYENTCQDLKYKDGDYGSIISPVSEKGDTVTIFWSTQDDSSFDWTLTVLPLKPGDQCRLASTASIGINTASRTPQWFEFKAPEAGEYVVASLGRLDTTYVKVYLNCEEAVVNRDEQATITLSLAAEQIIYIEWYDLIFNGTEDYSSTSFDWTIRKLESGKTAQTIDFYDLLDRTVEESTFELTATASSGLLVTYTSSNESVATVSGSTVTLLGPGTTSIIARQIGDDTYSPAPLVAQRLTVTICQSLSAIIAETTAVSCQKTASGSTKVSATGGVAPYSYSLDGTTFQTEASFVGLDSGTYVITIQDTNGCTATVEAKITAPEVLLVSGQASPATRSATSGGVALNVSGGTAPYHYAWSNEATTASIDGLTIGDYSVTVTDAAGCSVTTSFTVEGVTALDDEEPLDVQVYPNPAAVVLYIDVPLKSQAKHATFYNSLGSKITTVSLISGRNRVDTQALKPGSYILQLDDGSYRRVVIE